MSGGTWDYQQHRLRDLAEEIREGRARWSGSEPDELGLPEARAFLADLLGVAYDLMHELDWHFAGDSFIADEKAWVDESVRRTVHHVMGIKE